MRPPNRALLTLAALLLATSAHAQVYKCRIDGQMVFSDQPCAADAKPIDVRPASGRAATPAPGETAAPVSPAAQFKARGDQMERERRVRDLDHRISVEHSRIRDQDSIHAALAGRIGRSGGVSAREGKPVG